MIDPISVPFAPTPYKIICGIPLLILAALALSWGSKNLRLCIRILQGKLPLPSGSSPPFAVIGIFFYLAVLAVGVGAAVFFVALETIRPTIVSQDGILVGAALPHYRQRLIPWDAITKVTCYLPPREIRIRSLCFYSQDSQGRRSRDRREKSPQRHNSPLRTHRARSFVVLLAAKNHNPFSIDGK